MKSPEPSGLFCVRAHCFAKQKTEGLRLHSLKKDNNHCYPQKGCYFVQRPSYLSAMKIMAFVFLLSLQASLLCAQAACPPFWNDIQAFKKSDSLQPPPKGAILFVGSSSFTKWTDVQEYFPGYSIVNRGFGGSRIIDVIRYAYDVILPYAPRQIVVYCGENDLADNPAATATDVVLRFKTLFAIVRQNLPDADVAFVSLKPSPSRKALLPKFRETNTRIEAFLKGQRRAKFINVYNAMLGKNGEPQKDLFLDDNLHMNKAGYAIWHRIILPYLRK